MSLLKNYCPRILVAVMLLWSGVLASGATHTIKSGDTLYSLARHYKTSVAQFKSVNGLSDADVKRLKVGQRLTIPGSSSSSTSSRSKSSSSSKSSVSRVGGGRRVVIDAGHGGKDWGAHQGGVKEAYLNLRVAQKLESELKDRGYAVTMTRRSDTFVSLSRRAAIANRYRKAIFVCVHFNCTSATWVRGVETYYGGSAGRPLALAIQREILRRCNVRNRGVRFARFTVLVQTRCPAVLVECGFISNPSERSRCATSSYQSAMAVAIAEGITKFKW